MATTYSLSIYVEEETYIFLKFLSENKAITHRAQIQSAMKRYDQKQAENRFYHLASDITPTKEFGIDIRYLTESRNVMFILKKEV